MTVFEWLQILQTVVMLAAGVFAFALRNAVLKSKLADDVAQLREDVDAIDAAGHRFRNHTLPELLKGYITKETADARFNESIEDRQRIHNQLSQIMTRLLEGR